MYASFGYGCSGKLNSAISRGSGRMASRRSQARPGSCGMQRGGKVGGRGERDDGEWAGRNGEGGATARRTLLPPLDVVAEHDHCLMTSTRAPERPGGAECGSEWCNPAALEHVGATAVGGVAALPTCRKRCMHGLLSHHAVSSPSSSMRLLMSRILAAWASVQPPACHQASTSSLESARSRNLAGEAATAAATAAAGALTGAGLTLDPLSILLATALLTLPLPLTALAHVFRSDW